MDRCVGPIAVVFNQQDSIIASFQDVATTSVNLYYDVERDANTKTIHVMHKISRTACG